MPGAYHSADATVAARRGVAVTPTDGTLIPATRALYIGVGGNLNVRMAGDDTVVLFSNVPVGVFPIQVTEVKSTSTTATSIIALY